VIEELHIASLVVHSTPRRVRGVSDAIATIPGARVHAASAGGKLVVTLEASTADEMVARVSHIQHTDGVLSAALVYQCVDTLAAMNELIPDVDHDTTRIH
jgi:nitrate reductase NapD